MNQLQHAKTSLDDFTHFLHQNWKISVKFVSFIMAVALSLGTISFIEIFPPGMKILQVLTFLAAGILNIYFLKNKFYLLGLQFSLKDILYTILFAVVICIALIIFYLIVDISMLTMAFASSCAFLLPQILSECWTLFKNIPEKQYSFWTKPLVHDTDENEILFPGSINLQLKIKNGMDKKQEVILPLTTVPVQMKPGKIFYSFLEHRTKKYDETDKIAVNEINTAGWEFYTESMRGLIQRRIDPELNLKENGVRRNATILIRRIIQK